MDFDLDFVNPEVLDENEEGEGLDQPQRGDKSRKAEQMQPM